MARSNLFAIDMEAILRAIAEANAALVDHHHKMMEARTRVPPVLATEQDIERAKRYVDMLQAVADRCREARLSDTKPLRELVKKVEGFFKQMEAQAAQARREVISALTEAGRRQAALRPPTPKIPVVEAAPPHQPTTVLLNTETGEVLGTTLPPPPQVEKLPPIIPMKWEIEAVDRTALDLEALRPHLTDAALMTAARAHLKAHGPHVLRGASYFQQAAW